MKKEVYPGIYHGDELEWCGKGKCPQWVKNPVAWYANSYTLYNRLDGRVSFRVSDYNYGSSEDNSHSLHAYNIRPAMRPYDPTQMGDKEDDI